MSLVEKTLNQQIRDNRLKLKQKIKLSMIPNQKKQKLTLIKNSSNNLQIETETHSKGLHRIVLAQKQLIQQGSFEDNYILKEKIGEGAHATVYKCIQKSTGKAFAVKIVKHSDQELIVSAKMSYKIFKKLDHDGIMKVQAFYINREKMTTYLICQLCTYPQLAIYLRNRKTKFIQESQATMIITLILQSLQYLHKNGVCHRDIKPENILYDHIEKKIKIIDFDCAKNKRQSDTHFEMWTKTGSIHYQAPQYFQSTVYDEKVDIWAVGIIAYELITGNVLFKSSYCQRMIQMITSQEIRIDILPVSQDFKTLLRKLLERDSQKRFAASQCLRLPLILKTKMNHLIQTVDDFDIQISTCPSESPLSCKEINFEGCNQMMTSQRNPEIKQSENYCFIVNEMSQI